VVEKTDVKLIETAVHGIFPEAELGQKTKKPQKLMRVLKNWVA
jgi:hypothetical protein